MSLQNKKAAIDISSGTFEQRQYYPSIRASPNNEQMRLKLLIHRDIGGNDMKR